MFDDELDYSKLSDGGDRDDAPRRGRRDPSEYPDEGENPEDYEDWEEGEETDDGEHDGDGENPDFEEEEKFDKEEWQREQEGWSSGDGGMNPLLGVISPTAAIIAMVAAVSLFSPGKSDTSAAFDYLNPHGTSMDYGIHISMEYHPEEEASRIDWNNADTGLVLVAKNPKESVSVPLVTGGEGTDVSVIPRFEEGKPPVYEIDMTFTGTIEGLEEKRPYDISIMGTGGNTTQTYCTNSTKTAEKQTEIRGFDGECTCAKDGNYNFRLDYTDENNYYSDFSYELLSPDHQRVTDGRLDTLNGWQMIPNVDELYGDDYTLVLHIQSSDPKDAAADKEKIELDNGLSVLYDHGSITITQEITL